MDQVSGLINSVFSFKFDIVGLLNMIKTADFMSLIMVLVGAVVD